MTNSKTTRRALVLSLLSLLLCCSMLVGTTFAWFTDSVTSGNNKIVAGNLDIELEYSKDMVNWGAVEGKTDLFSSNLWEPGHTEVVYLRLRNLGTLALKYQFSINFTDTVIGKNAKDEDIKLSEHLKYDIVDVSAKYADRDAARKAVAASAMPLAAYEVKGEMLVGAADKVMALVVYMPEEVGNEANYRGADIPQIDLGLDLLATQLVQEADSFGNDYDAGASLGASDNVIKPTTYPDLVKALAEAVDGTTIQLENDITAEGPVYATYSGEGAITIDLNGHVLKGPFGTLLKLTNGSVVLKNGTLKNVHEAATETQYSLYLSGAVAAEVKDVTIETSGVGIHMEENAKITELNANIISVMNANGYCCFDAVSLWGNARIDRISGGTYESKYTDAFIESWYNDSNHYFSGIASWTINLNDDGTSIGEIADGTFLGIMDKAQNGTPIHVRSGKVELISGGYFGFSRMGLTAPDNMLYAGAGASIEKITGGKFEKPQWKYGCDFAGIVDASGCKAEATGETVEVKTQFTTRVATYTLQVLEVTAK